MAFDLNSLNTDHKFCPTHEEVAALKVEITKLRAENERLRAALRRYGRHSDLGESKYTCTADYSSSKECICGLDKALEENRG